MGLAEVDTEEEEATETTTIVVDQTDRATITETKEGISRTSSTKEWISYQLILFLFLKILRFDSDEDVTLGGKKISFNRKASGRFVNRNKGNR